MYRSLTGLLQSPHFLCSYVLMCHEGNPGAICVSGVTTDSFKHQLDRWLNTVLDELPTPGYPAWKHCNEMSHLGGKCTMYVYLHTGTICWATPKYIYYILNSIYRYFGTTRLAPRGAGGGISPRT